MRLTRGGAIALALLLVTVLGVIAAATSVQQLRCSSSDLDPSNNAGLTDKSGGVPLPSVNPAAQLHVSVVSWNSYYRNSVANVVRGFRAIEAAGGGVVGLQEQINAGKRQQLVSRLSPTWSFVGTSTRQPIAYRTGRYRVVASGVVEAHGPRRAESGPGGRSVEVKWIVWVQLEDVRTGGRFAVIGDHKIAGVERAGRFRKDKPIRVRLWHEEDQAVGRVINQLKPLGVPIFKTADENVAARRHSYLGYDEQMQKRGMYSSWRVLGYPERGTHNDRLIDYVWSTTRLAAPVRQRILGKYGSDHSILIVDLDNARAVAATRLTPAAPVAAVLSRPAPVVGPGVGPAPAGSLRRQQVANAKLVAEGVRAAGGSGRAVYVALVAAVGESDLVNVGYGDKAGPDSRGLFQQRNTWGTLSERMNPSWAAGAFMLGPHQGGHGGLLQLRGWENLPVTLAIHRVQINANPNHYAKFESRATEIGRQAGLDFEAPAGVASTTSAVTPACPRADPAAGGAEGPALDSGPCPLDQLHAPRKANARDCNVALTWLAKAVSNGDSRWYRRCMALVAVAYGWSYSGNDTAYLGARRVEAAGQMHASRTGIPKGAVLWWDGRRTGNSAGHVAIYDGNGYIFSNDVKGHGTVGRVPWDFPEKQWGQRFIGWSSPYFPNAG